MYTHFITSNQSGLKSAFGFFNVQYATKWFDGFSLVQPFSSPDFVPSEAMLTAGWEHEWRGGGYKLMIRVRPWEITPQTHTHSLCFCNAELPSYAWTVIRWQSGPWWKVTVMSECVYFLCMCKCAHVTVVTYTVSVDDQLSLLPLVEVFHNRSFSAFWYYATSLTK